MNTEVLNKISSIQESFGELIFNSAITTLDYFYSFIERKYTYRLSNKFLEYFNTPKDFVYSTIEQNFCDFCYDNLIFYVDDIKFDINAGIYFLYNQEGNIVYVGKSRNLKDRIVSSFTSKLPYGVKTFKYVEIRFLKAIDDLEGIMIDYFKPVLNQKKERTPNGEDYYGLIRSYLSVLDNQKEHWIRIGAKPDERDEEMEFELDVIE